MSKEDGIVRRSTASVTDVDYSCLYAIIPNNSFISPKSRQFYKSKRVKELIFNTLTLPFVRVKGLEPIRARHQILSLAWLPITTHPQ